MIGNEIRGLSCWTNLPNLYVSDARKGNDSSTESARRGSATGKYSAALVRRGDRSVRLVQRSNAGRRELIGSSASLASNKTTSQSIASIDATYRHARGDIPHPLVAQRVRPSLAICEREIAQMGAAGGAQ
jgi:hypothetical protein